MAGRTPFGRKAFQANAPAAAKTAIATTPAMIL
jgi:hypothetical protein